jgi:hypothetical protein
MRSLRSAGLAVGALVGLATLRALTTPPWPDDWDGVGFVESVTRFDLDHFVPHPPGYPVYVALLRAAAVFSCEPMLAANVVAVVAGIAAVALLTLATACAYAWSEAAWVGLFVALAPLVWRTSTAVGSEAPALALASAAVFGATRTGRAASWWIGVSVGLGLGVRLSWAPLFLPLLALAPRGERLRALLLASAATLAWVVPFVAVVGAKHLLVLARTHATGHFEVWGGSALSEPGRRRMVWLARDAFVDGLGLDRDPLGIAIAALTLSLAWFGMGAWRKAGRPVRPLLVTLPYLVWIALGQNLHQQPRHALPLVVALAGALALAAATSPRARLVGGVLLALMAARTATDAYARRTIPPPGEQLVALVQKFPSGAAAFGGPSARFFELARGATGVTVGTLGDVQLALGRLSPLPSRVLVTSELQDLEKSSYPLIHIDTLCRPPRVDRRAPCIDVFDWKVPFLRR